MELNLLKEHLEFYTSVTVNFDQVTIDKIVGFSVYRKYVLNTKIETYQVSYFLLKCCAFICLDINGRNDKNW